jgi:DNA-binding transcriptional LysR family regulator
MNIKQIETFRWIVRLGSFAAAAERLNSTQSAVSIRIHELEESLGVKLFDRSHRAAKLTPKGQELLALADRLMGIVWEIRSCVGDPEALSGVVRVGVADLIAVTWLGDLVMAVREQFPRVIVDLEIGLTHDLVEKLRRGELDLVLVPGDVTRSEFVAESLGAVNFVWAASPKLGIPDKVLTPQDLQEWPVITLSKHSYHYQTIENWFRKSQAICRRVVVCNSISVMMALTRDGLGVGFIPVSCFDDEGTTDKLRVIQCRPPIPPVEFFAMCPIDRQSNLARTISRLAVEVSGFPKTAVAAAQ